MQAQPDETDCHTPESDAERAPATPTSTECCGDACFPVALAPAGPLAHGAPAHSLPRPRPEPAGVAHPPIPEQPPPRDA